MKRHAAIVALMGQLNQHIQTGAAEQLRYATSVVTQCYDPLESSVVSVTDTSTAPWPQGTVCYTMPTCESCGCSSCTITSTFTTTYSLFCSTGLTAQLYTVTETYVGVSSLPTFSPPTTIPYGFTTSEASCTICGTTILVTPMTYPSGGSPYSTEIDGSDPTQTATAIGPQETFTRADDGAPGLTTLSTTVQATVYTTFLTVKNNSTDITSIINGTSVPLSSGPTDQVVRETTASPEDTSIAPSFRQTGQDKNSESSESSSPSGVYSSAASLRNHPARSVTLLLGSLGVCCILNI